MRKGTDEEAKKIFKTPRHVTQPFVTMFDGEYELSQGVIE
jgi:hypothetical protein